MRAERLLEYMEEVESEREYDGYYYSLGEALTIVVLGSLCGLKNVSQIHQWAESERTREWLKEKFAIERIPCYYWLLSLLKMVKPESLNQCLSRWVRQILPEEREGLTLAVDGKTVRSTEGKKGYQRPLHIISAQLSELGVTLASKSVDGKSNEIPAVQELLPAKATICSASRRINLLSYAGYPGLCSGRGSARGHVCAKHSGEKPRANRKEDGFCHAGY